MSVATVIGWDATHANINSAPVSGQASLYITGSGGVPATAADLRAHPTCVRIDQSPIITSIDTTADDFDVERGAITIAELGQVIHDAIAHWHANSRPGQRWPAVYCSRANVTPVVNALNAAGLGNAGIGLHIADWNNSLSQATSEVANPSGPFPVVGRQYQNAVTFDRDVYSVPWLKKVSGAVTSPGEYTVQALPPGIYKEGTPVVMNGVGTDGKVFTTVSLDGRTWTKPVRVS